VGLTSAAVKTPFGGAPNDPARFHQVLAYFVAVPDSPERAAPPHAHASPSAQFAPGAPAVPPAFRTAEVYIHTDDDELQRMNITLWGPAAAMDIHAGDVWYMDGVYSKVFMDVVTLQASASTRFVPLTTDQADEYKAMCEAKTREEDGADWD
jgi:hypothetical protein